MKTNGQSYGLTPLMSGSMQGAGGVGGLIEVSYYGGTNTTNCFVGFDGNGNVSTLVNAADATTLAIYEYGPFGEVIRATGPLAKVNPFGFSTKYNDDESGFLYYGFRYYNPNTGRWLSRDPAEEDEGGPNLYGFVGNDPVDQIDDLGLVIVGFYGADTWFTFPNDGNVQMKAIADAVGAPIYRSLDIMDPYQYLLKYFHSTSGCSNNNEAIKIFGHSWGGISAVKLSRWVGRSELRNHEIDVYVIDPVSTLRLPPTSVPSSVTTFWNRYQTHGKGVTIAGRPVHGRSLTSHATSSDQKDLNPGPNDNGIDHWTIIGKVKDELIGKLRN